MDVEITLRPLRVAVGLSRPCGVESMRGGLARLELHRKLYRWILQHFHDLPRQLQPPKRLSIGVYLVPIAASPGSVAKHFDGYVSPAA